MPSPPNAATAADLPDSPVRVPVPVSPQPRRVRRPSWLDVRLVVGLALVLGSVVLGARVVAGAHRTVAVVAITHDAQPGTILAAADLTTVQVRMAEPGVYLVRPDLAVGRQLNRPLSGGELVPRSALGVAAPLTRIELPLAQDAAPVLARGELIDVWLSGAHCPPALVVSGVAVQRVRDASGSYGSAAGQAVEISLSAAMADRVLAALSVPDGQLRAGVLAGTPPADVDEPLAPIPCPGGGQGS